MKRILWCAALLLSCGMVRAQDIHFSQFYETSVLRNPALTGIFSNDYKVGVTYRNQWTTLGRPFRTGELSVEMRFPVNREGSDYLSIGLLGYYDKAGKVSLQTVGVYPALNFNKSMGDRHNSYLSVGFTGGYLQRSYDAGAMTFDNQYQNGSVIAGAGSGESLPDPKLQSWDLGAGVSFNSGIGANNNVNYFIGLAAYHVTRPRSTFSSTANGMNLQARWNASLGLDCTLNDVWSLQLHGNYMLQGAYQEIIGGGLLKWGQTNDRNSHVFAISAGAFYRYNDAVIPTLKIDYKKQSFGISYDVNVSSLKTATNLRGGLEVTAFLSGLFGGSFEDKRSCPRF